MRTHQSRSSSRRATLISHLYYACEPAPEFLDQSPRQSPALKSDQRRRPTDKLQNLSWNPGRARGSDPSLLASHLNGPWHGICVQEGSGFVTESSLAENFHVITQHHCVSCTLRYSTWAFEGMVVSGKFRRAPRPAVLLSHSRQCSHRQ